MNVWSKYKFLILFLTLAIGGPIVATNLGKSFFQEAQIITSKTPICLTKNPPAVWVEKDLTSRSGQLISGLSNVDLFSVTLIVCGDVNINGMDYIIESENKDILLSDSSFGLYAFGQRFNTQMVKDNGNKSILVRFSFEEPIRSKDLGSNQSIKFMGTIPKYYEGKITFSFKEIRVDEPSKSNISIDKISNTLVFFKGE